MEQISNRKFGLFLSIMLLFIAFYLFEQPYSFSFKLFASLFLLLTTFTVFIPKALLPLKHLWFLIGFWLGRFISPLVLGLIYFLIITPLALFLRIKGRDELSLKKNNKFSYWKERKDLGPESSSFKNQF